MKVIQLIIIMNVISIIIEMNSIIIYAQKMKYVLEYIMDYLKKKKNVLENALMIFILRNIISFALKKLIF